MKYSSFLKATPNTSKTSKNEELVETTEKVVSKLIIEASNPVDILRKGGFKIRLVTPTSFGTQIDFAKKYDESELKDVLKGFNIKIKEKSLFVID